MKLKKVRVILLALLVITLLVFSSVYADDGSSSAGSDEEEETAEVTLLEDGYTFSPKLIIPGKWDDWKVWRTARLIEKGSLDYYEIIPIRNSGTTKINFDPEKVVYRIDGEKSEIVLEKKYFKLGDLPHDLGPNEEFNIEVWINKELILKDEVPVDNYKGSINFWVEETENYLSIPVDIKFKSSIGYAILWILIGAFAYPVGKKVVEKLEILETRAKWDKIYRNAIIMGKNAIGWKNWLKDYLDKLWDDYYKRNISIKDKLDLIGSKFLDLLYYEEHSGLPDYLKKNKNVDTKPLIAAYKKLEESTKETVEADTDAVKKAIVNILGRSRARRDALRKTEESFFAKLSRDFKLWWGTVFLNLWMFLAWVFLTGLLVFTGLSENYTNVDLWGSNPIKDWGDLFTWALSSNLVTTSAKDLIITNILKKETGEEGEG